MRIRMTLLIDVDAEKWDQEFDTSKGYEVRADVKRYILTLIQASEAAEFTNLTVELEK
jgi:hypothetical protein